MYLACQIFCLNAFDIIPKFLAKNVVIGQLKVIMSELFDNPKKFMHINFPVNSLTVSQDIVI